MFAIELTQRTITQHWNKETQQHEEVITDESIYVNPELVEFISPAGDAPRKYQSHIHLNSGWNLFVLEPPGFIEAVIRGAAWRGQPLLVRATERERQQGTPTGQVTP